MLWRRISRHDVLAAAKREGRAAGRGASPCTYIEGHFTTGFGPMPASAMTTPGFEFSRSGRLTSKQMPGAQNAGDVSADVSKSID